MNKLPYYRAVRSFHRRYGYTVQDVYNATFYFSGPHCTGGWYKYKRDAIKAAQDMNKSVERMVLSYDKN